MKHFTHEVVEVLKIVAIIAVNIFVGFVIGLILISILLPK